MKITRTDFFAAIAAIFVTAGWFWWADVVRKALPASEWFEVQTLNIPGFAAGDDPGISYERVIKKSFPGSYKILITSTEKEDGAIVCANSKKIDYLAGRELPPVVTMSWLFGEAEWPSCSAKLGEGTYIARVSWDIEEPGYPAKTYKKISNVFRVLPEGSQFYIDPKQVQQLEKAQELLNEGAPQ